MRCFDGMLIINFLMHNALCNTSSLNNQWCGLDAGCYCVQDMCGIWFMRLFWKFAFNKPWAPWESCSLTKSALFYRFYFGKRSVVARFSKNSKKSAFLDDFEWSCQTTKTPAVSVPVLQIVLLSLQHWDSDLIKTCMVNGHLKCTLYWNKKIKMAPFIDISNTRLFYSALENFL